jgi:hypothetical protein
MDGKEAFLVADVRQVCEARCAELATNGMDGASEVLRPVQVEKVPANTFVWELDS